MQILRIGSDPDRGIVTLDLEELVTQERPQMLHSRRVFFRSGVLTRHLECVRQRFVHAAEGGDHALALQECDVVLAATQPGHLNDFLAAQQCCEHAPQLSRRLGRAAGRRHRRLADLCFPDALALLDTPA